MNLEDGHEDKKCGALCSSLGMRFHTFLAHTRKVPVFEAGETKFIAAFLQAVRTVARSRPEIAKCEQGIGDTAPATVLKHVRRMVAANAQWEREMSRTDFPLEETKSSGPASADNEDSASDDDHLSDSDFEPEEPIRVGASSRVTRSSARSS
jgi:hypothetical protein